MVDNLNEYYTNYFINGNNLGYEYYLNKNKIEDKEFENKLNKEIDNLLEKYTKNTESTENIEKGILLVKQKKRFIK